MGESRFILTAAHVLAEALAAQAREATQVFAGPLDLRLDPERVRLNDSFDIATIAITPTALTSPVRTTAGSVTAPSIALRSRLGTSRLLPAPSGQSCPARNLPTPFRAQLRGPFPGELRSSSILLARFLFAHARNCTATRDTPANGLDFMLAQA